MTFELIPDATSPREGDAKQQEEPSVEPPVMIVSSDMDWLVQCHLRILPTIGGHLWRRPRLDRGVASSSQETLNEYSADETFMTMLKLLSAFYNISLYNRAMNFEVESSSVDEDFHCNALTVLPRSLETEVPECSLVGDGDFEVEVSEGGIQIQLTHRATSTRPARFCHPKGRSAQLKVYLQLGEVAMAPKKVCEVLLPMAAPEGHLQLQALPFGLQGPVGSHIWPCAQLCAAYLRRRFAYGEAWAARTLDLGSGCGVSGLVAAAHGAKVTFSDCDPRVLPLLRKNSSDFARRQGLGTQSVLRFDFTSEQETQDLAAEGLFDLILASDVLYDHRLVKPLCRALAALLKRTGEAALSVELRPCGVDLRAAVEMEAQNHGLNVTDVTDMLKIWVTPMPPELQVPPLEERHRMFVAKWAKDGAAATREINEKKVKSQQPWKHVGEEAWYKRSLQFWSKQEASDAGVLAGHVETSPLDLRESAAFFGPGG
ncbi:unnamed protein product [Durusdinium trenchii]|uniref:Calmodulin-lysine N-methyltransferase n=1 Tax=Durusdinium trenchii TaxID=1381693 RepID=A0ABP0HL76_9DINO